MRFVEQATCLTPLLANAVHVPLDRVCKDQAKMK